MEKTTKNGRSKMLLVGMILFTFCTFNANAGPFEYYEVFSVQLIREPDKESRSAYEEILEKDGGYSMNILPNELYYKIKHYADNEINAKLNTWYGFVLSPFGANDRPPYATVLIKWTAGNKYEWYGWRVQ
ncbi:MAG: hypothetical protein Ta2B_15150 [Termitinemataceae bacterium]|nr:MAG: hypothetical protein Ta2B_15150 [Termitinemataceae bacterium]